jgi:hypothetical protein
MYLTGKVMCVECPSKYYKKEKDNHKCLISTVIIMEECDTHTQFARGPKRRGRWDIYVGNTTPC